MKNKKFVIKKIEKATPYKKEKCSFYKGFDGEFCYDFHSKKQYALKFDNKRSAVKELKKFKKDCSSSIKEFKNVFDYKIERY